MLISPTDDQYRPPAHRGPDTGAPKGNVLVVADSSQIEARTLAWEAGQDDLVEAFAQGRDVYSEFASDAYGRKIDRKNNPEDETPGQAGKISVLGLGYQMGVTKFSVTLLSGAMGPPIQFTNKEAVQLGVDVDNFERRWRRQEKRWQAFESTPSRLTLPDRLVHTAVSERFVDTYRKKNNKIVAYWKLCEEVIKVMAPDEGDHEAVRGTFGPGEFLKVGRHWIELPNGMRLRYPGLRESDDGSGYSYVGGDYGKARKKIYGGLLAENLTQALARIIVAEQMLIIRAAGIRIVTMTHDEVVAVAPESEGKATLEFMIATMKRPPTWAVGLPLSAEGGFNRSYGMAK